MKTLAALIRKYVPLFALLLALSPCIVAQEAPVVDIDNRIDLSNTSIREISERWAKYASTNPDSVAERRKYWCRSDQEKFKDFDFTQPFLYSQMPFNFLLTYYYLVILSIEKEGDAFAIRTGYLAKSSTEEFTKGQNPWAIIRVYAIREENTWKFTNAFNFRTKAWIMQRFGPITYHFDAGHPLNVQEAEKSVHFCDSLAAFLDIRQKNKFDYYICPAADQLCELLGFDYCVSAYTTGIAFHNDLLISGTGSAFYPHEFVHQATGALPNYFIGEGSATWLGGVMGKSFITAVKDLSNAVAKNDTVSLDDVLERKWGWHVNAFYVSGAIMCKTVYDRKGVAGLKQLFVLPEDDSLLKAKLKELLGEDPEKVWRKELLKYKTE
jgi:hypothetical protein